MFRLLWIGLMLAGLLIAGPIGAQDGCADALPAQVAVGDSAIVSVDTNFFLNIRAEPGMDSEPLVQLADGELVDIVGGPECIDGLRWWQVQQFNLTGWAADSANGDYLLEPYDVTTLPTLVPPPTVPVTTERRNLLSLDNGLPIIVPTDNPDTLATSFFTWDWDAMIAEENIYGPPAPDPLAIRLPETYMGDLPSAPFELADVRFVEDANLTTEQQALLAENGFVVVPGGWDQFEGVYRWQNDWNPNDGNAYWVTTDALLHALHVAFDNFLTFLEQDALFSYVRTVALEGYQAAAAQAATLTDDDVTAIADGVAVYYAVALGLLDPALYAETVSDDHAALADPLIAAALAGEGRLPVPFLGESYREDFSQYIPRGSYATSERTQRYFRAMMWFGRITFLARDDESLVGGLLVMRALVESGTYDEWQTVAELLEFIIGPEDNLGPAEYRELAESVFGAGLPLDALTDPDRLDSFRTLVATQPGPRVHNVVRPVGTTEDELDTATRGFRLFGQRFTFDGYAMQRLIYPAVGEVGNERILPSGLDVAAVLGSDIAYALADAQGATDYANYSANLADLRLDVNQIEPVDWMESIYGGWLWALQPLWVRDDAAYPPLMQSEAWKLRDLHAGLGSWAELKHDTLLYTVQPMGGLGGGGDRIMTAYSAVEPNPYVFARIAIVAAALEAGLEEREVANGGAGLQTVRESFGALKILAAQVAELARKELWGEPLSDDDQLFLKYDFGSRLWYVRYLAELSLDPKPEMAAIVADVASNPDAGLALAVGTGYVDTIYVVTDSPNGLQVTRGTVYSFYEFNVPIDQRPTDEAWREQLQAGDAPPRPDWISRYFAE
jgi:hypothetical protein